MDRNTGFSKTAAVWIQVATREGGVDRNIHNNTAYVSISPVATREGGVDRNKRDDTKQCTHIMVATREGGVDRNAQTLVSLHIAEKSPPARVAWIETLRQVPASALNAKSPPARVAWIETSNRSTILSMRGRSPPARVAWIETTYSFAHSFLHLFVATREGGVDRNSSSLYCLERLQRSPPARVAWIETRLE